ncbi:MAG: TetR/AcrR family transcriptional regulator [Leptonema sp. (in: bacteria)]
MERMGKPDKENSSGEEQGKQKKKFPRVEKRREKIKKNILELAKKKFANENPYIVKFETFAEEVEISRASLYSYFDSKEEILEEILKPVLEELIEKYEILLKNLKNETPLQIIENLIEILIQAKEHHQLSLVVLSKLLELNDHVLTQNPLYHRMLEVQQTILEKIEKELKFPKEVASQLLVKCGLSLINLLFGFGLPESRKLLKETIKKLISK